MTAFAVALCAPSGTGKTTVARGLVDALPDLVFSVSATTRPPRTYETPGVHYRFVSRPEFEAMVREDELLEWAEVHGERYGTPRTNLEEAERQGKLLLLDIDVQGARQVVESRSDTVTIFLLPPSSEVLLERLRGRGSEDPEGLRRRLETARRELSAVSEFEYVVVNDRLEDTIETVRSIIVAERHRQARSAGEVEELRGRLLEGLDGV